MKKINIRRAYYRLRHEYLTMNNVVVGIALVIGAGWAWGSIGMMQRNYDLQKGIDAKARQQQLNKLQVQLLQYEQNYYKSDEYKEWSARRNFGLAKPGEKVVVLPANSEEAKKADIGLVVPARQSLPPNNFTQWMNFLFGGSRPAS